MNQARTNQNKSNQKKTELVFALLAASSKIERRFDRVLSGIRGVSFTEYFLLKRLNEQPGRAATRVDLAASVHLTPSAVTRALKPLEKTGYVISEKSDRDARQSIARLTSAGEELLRDTDNLIADEVSAIALPASQSKALQTALDSLMAQRFGR